MKEGLLLLVATVSIWALPPDAPIRATDFVKLMGNGVSYDYSINDSLGNKVGGIGWCNFHEDDVDSIIKYTDGGGRIRLGYPAPPVVINPETFEWSQYVLDSIETIVDAFIARGIPIGISLGEPAANEWAAETYSDLPLKDQLIKAGIASWKGLAEYFKDKSHLLFFDLFIEYQGGKNIVSRDSCDTIYWEVLDTLTKVIRETNPTRILSYKAWGVARTGLEKMPFPFGNDDDTYVLGDFGGIASGGPDINDDAVLSEEEKEKTLERAIIPNSLFRDSTGIPVWAGVWGYLSAMDKTPPKKPESLRLEYIDWYMQYLAQYEIPGAYSQFRDAFPQKDGRGWDYEIAKIFQKHNWKNKTIWYDKFVYPITVDKKDMDNLNPDNTGKLLSHSINGGDIHVSFVDSVLDSMRIKRIFTSTDKAGNATVFWQVIKVENPNDWPASATYNSYTIKGDDTPIISNSSKSLQKLELIQNGNSLSLKFPLETNRVMVYSMSGRILVSKEVSRAITQASIDVSHLSRGSYILEIKGTTNMSKMIVLW